MNRPLGFAASDRVGLGSGQTEVLYPDSRKDSGYFLIHLNDRGLEGTRSSAKW